MRAGRKGRRALGRFAAALVLALLGTAAQAQPGETKIEDRVEALLARMTLEEKAGQLNLVSLEPGFERESVRRGEVSAVINFSNEELTSGIDAVARSSRLGIPLLIGLDIIHGYRTIFPMPLGLAASFDPDLVRRASEAAAREAAAVGLNWTFSPMADVARDPRWGRVVEGPGEDPWLASRMTVAQVEGFRAGGLAATLKHFAGYSAALGGRDYDAALVAPTDLRDIHLPPFRAGIQAGSESVMTTLTSLDGLPTTADGGLLKRILRGDLGFDGLVVADWEAVAGLIKHGVARDGADATRQAFRAGVDMDMTSGLYVRHLPEEVRAGRIPEAAVDAAVRRVLRVKFGLGLFDRPVLDPATAAAKLLTPETRSLAREAARASFVLLKNSNSLLPIEPARVGRIAVIGPLADAPWDQIGPHEGTGHPDHTVTVLAGLKERAAAAGIAVTTEAGCDTACVSQDGFPAAVAAAHEADLVVAVLGESRRLSGEGSSRAYLTLPGRQGALLAELAETGRPIVLVLMGGRPIELGAARAQAGAILMTWFAGTEGGPAVAEVLFGDASPRGKLPMTWPYTIGQLPLTYDRRPGGRPHQPGVRWTMGYADETPEPLFPFGFGLSYGRFTYGEPEVLTPRIDAADPATETLAVRVAVTNAGPRAGRETAQLYLGQPVAGRSRPERLLKATAAVDLVPGETRSVGFQVPLRDFGYHEPDGTLVVDAGTYRIFVGGDSLAPRTAEFAVETGLREPPGSATRRRADLREGDGGPGTGAPIPD